MRRAWVLAAAVTVVVSVATGCGGGSQAQQPADAQGVALAYMKALFSDHPADARDYVATDNQATFDALIAIGASNSLRWTSLNVGKVAKQADDSRSTVDRVTFTGELCPRSDPASSGCIRNSDENTDDQTFVVLVTKVQGSPDGDWRVIFPR